MEVTGHLQVKKIKSLVWVGSEELGRATRVLHRAMLRIGILLKDYCLSVKGLVNVLHIQTISRNFPCSCFFSSL